MEFPINSLDVPRVLKNNCKPEDDWKKCSCDKDFSIPSHGFFLKPCTWKPIYEKVPLFSFGTLPQCFSDMLIPSPSHLKGLKAFQTPPWE